MLAVNFNGCRSHFLDRFASEPYDKRPVRHETVCACLVQACTGLRMCQRLPPASSLPSENLV